VSELREVRLGKADARVARWSDSVEAASLFISAVTLLELEIGVLLMERKDPPQGRQCAHGWTIMCGRRFACARFPSKAAGLLAHSN